MPFIKIYIHLVFSTKNRVPFLNTSAVRVKVWKHIKENASEKGIYVDMVNGFSDHCHCLISLGSNQNIEKVVQLIKGESSFWINKNELTREKFNILPFPFPNLWLSWYRITSEIRKSTIQNRLLNKNTLGLRRNTVLNKFRLNGIILLVNGL